MAAVVDLGWYEARRFELSLEDFRAVRLRTLRLTAPLTQAQLDYADGPDKWSVGEVLDHLIRSEELHRCNMEKVVRLAQQGKEPILHLGPADLDISFALVASASTPACEGLLSMPSEFMTQPACEYIISHQMLPFRTLNAVRPQWGLPVAELRARLLSSLESTAAVFRSHPSLDFRQLICQHDLLGPMNLLELLQFMARHEAGHQEQIRAIVKAQ